MSRQIDDGELCPSCGEIPIAFYGYDKAECPNCGEQLRLSSDGVEGYEEDEEHFEEDV